MSKLRLEISSREAAAALPRDTICVVCMAEARPCQLQTCAVTFGCRCARDLICHGCVTHGGGIHACVVCRHPMQQQMEQQQQQQQVNRVWIQLPPYSDSDSEGFSDSDSEDSDVEVVEQVLPPQQQQVQQVQTQQQQRRLPEVSELDTLLALSMELVDMD